MGDGSVRRRFRELMWLLSFTVEQGVDLGISLFLPGLWVELLLWLMGTTGKHQTQSNSGRSWHLSACTACDNRLTQTKRSILPTHELRILLRTLFLGMLNCVKMLRCLSENTTRLRWCSSCLKTCLWILGMIFTLLVRRIWTGCWPGKYWTRKAWHASEMFQCFCEI